MRAKKLGRSELLAWVNGIVQSDYSKIENFSDGVGLCQIIDAFFNNVTPEVMKLKLNSKEKEDWQRNWCLLNEMLSKQRSYKQVDPIKMSKGNFSSNFEFVQFLYDYIYKTFNSAQPKKYKGLQRRVEILRSQYGNRINNDIKKYLPSHLLTNDVILQIDKEKYFGESSVNSSKVLSSNEGDKKENDGTKSEYIKFFKLLEEDLNFFVKENNNLEEEIKMIEDEKMFYLDKIKTILLFCEKKKKKTQNEKLIKILNDIIQVITTVPEDFK